MYHPYMPLFALIVALTGGGLLLINRGWGSLRRGEAAYDGRSRRESLMAVIVVTVLGLLLVACGCRLWVKYMIPVIVSEW